MRESVTRPQWKEWKANVRWGLIWGLAFGVFYTLIVTVLTLLRGLGPLERMGFSLQGAIAVYLGGGLFGGLVVGVLRPVTVWRAGAIGVGLLVFVPLMYAIMSMMVSSGERDIALIGAVALGSIFGAYFGSFLWREHYGPPD